MLGGPAARASFPGAGRDPGTPAAKGVPRGEGNNFSTSTCSLKLPRLLQLFKKNSAARLRQALGEQARPSRCLQLGHCSGDIGCGGKGQDARGSSQVLELGRVRCPRVRVEGPTFNPSSATSGPNLSLRTSVFSSVKGDVPCAEHPPHRRRVPTCLPSPPGVAAFVLPVETEAARRGSIHGGTRPLEVAARGELLPRGLEDRPGTRISLPQRRGSRDGCGMTLLGLSWKVTQGASSQLAGRGRVLELCQEGVLRSAKHRGLLSDEKDPKYPAVLIETRPRQAST